MLLQLTALKWLKELVQYNTEPTHWAVHCKYLQNRLFLILKNQDRQEYYKNKYEGLTSTFIPPYGGYDGGIITQDGYQMITEDGIFDIQWEVFGI